MDFPKSWILLIVALDLRPLSEAKCLRPSAPLNGQFTPETFLYSVGDNVYYSCNGNYILFGVARRHCRSNGEWSEKVPFCDLASNSEISSAAQSSTMDPFGANLAYDGNLSTCSSTTGVGKQNWTGYLKKEEFVFSIRIFLPTGPVSLEIMLLNEKAKLHVCESLKSSVVSEPGEWKTILCKEKANLFIVNDKSNEPQPLRLCEVQLVTWEDSDGCSTPPSYDNIEGGKAIISRQVAFLTCDEDFLPDTPSSIKCVSGNWQNDTLKCQKRVTEQSTKYTNNTTEDYDKNINIRQDPKHIENHSNARHHVSGNTSNVIIIVASVAVALGVTSLVLGCLALLKRKRNTASSTSTTSTATMNTNIEENEGPPLYELMLYEDIPDNTPTLSATNKPTWGLPEIPSQEPINLDPYYSQPLEENTTQPCCLYSDTDHDGPYVDTEPQDAYKEPSGKCFGHTNCDRNVYTCS